MAWEKESLTWQGDTGRPEGKHLLLGMTAKRKLSSHGHTNWSSSKLNGNIQVFTLKRLSQLSSQELLLGLSDWMLLVIEYYHSGEHKVRFGFYTDYYRKETREKQVMKLLQQSMLESQTLFFAVPRRTICSFPHSSGEIIQWQINK